MRILEHTEKHPPTETEIAGILRWHEDRARVVANALESVGILAAVRSPFDVRFQLADTSRVDDLPEGEEVGDSIAREMEDFEKRSQSEAERLEKMFGRATAKKPDEDPTRALADDFGEFRRNKPRNPFGED